MAQVIRNQAVSRISNTNVKSRLDKGGPARKPCCLNTEATLLIARARMECNHFQHIRARIMFVHRVGRVHAEERTKRSASEDLMMASNSLVDHADGDAALVNTNDVMCQLRSTV